MLHLIIQGPTAARADQLPGPEPGTVFNVIGFLIVAKDRKQYLLVTTPQKTVLYIGQLGILNLMLFFRGRDHTIIAAKDSSKD